MVFVRPLNWIAERRWVAPTKGHLPLNEFDSSEAHVNDPHLLGYYRVYFRTTGKAVRIRGSHYRRSLTLRAKIHRQEQKRLRDNSGLDEMVGISGRATDSRSRCLGIAGANVKVIPPDVAHCGLVNRIDGKLCHLQIFHK